MNQLLCTEVFDHFLLAEATVTKDAAFTIDGHFNASFYSAEELEDEGLADCKILPMQGCVLSVTSLSEESIHRFLLNSF